MNLKISFLLPAVILLLFAKTLSTTQKETEENKTSSDKIVDLSGRGLQDIPESEKSRILHCEVLYLDDNNITTFPEWMKEAKQIRKISIKNNPFFNFLDFCVRFQSPALNEISASGCNIKDIPYQLTFFDNLTSFDFSNNIIEEIPYHLSFLKNIEHADFSNNRIKTTGYVVNAWRNLKSLDVTGNSGLQLYSLGESLDGLELEQLFIEFGDSVPESFKNISVGRV